MAANDVTSTIVVKAKNETESAFSKVKSDIDRVRTANESMATSVFKGVASWDILKRALGATTDFIKSSIEASSRASLEMALVKKNVENAGISYDSIKDKLEEYSKKMLQMGFDDEETATSMSRLMLVTKDYNKALTLNQLAGDLARNSGQGLEETTKALTMALGGNIRSLKLYVPELKAGASSAEVLAAVHEKVKGSMETFANTTQGKMEVMKVTYGNFKEQIGDIFGPALNIALTNFNSFLTATNNNAGQWSESTASKLQKGLSTLVNPDAWKLLGKSISTWGEQKLYDFGNAFVKVSDKIYGTKTPLTQSPYDRESQSMIDLEMKIESTEQAALALQKAVDTTVPSFDGMGSAGEDALKKQKDAMKSLLDKLKDYKQSIRDIQKAQEDESSSFIKSQIEKKQSFEQQLADMVKSHSEKWQQANKERIQLEEEMAKNVQEINKESEKEAKTKEERTAKAERLAELTSKAGDYGQKMLELQRTIQTEFAIAEPYLGNETLNKLSSTSDIERLITAFKATQAEDTVATSVAQQELKNKAQDITINFDLTNTVITDKNFIQTIKEELNKSLNLIRSTN